MNFLVVFGASYGLGLPSDLFLSLASTTVSPGDIQRYNVMYRLLSIGTMLWNLAIGIVSIIVLKSFVSNLFVTLSWNYEMATSVIATVFSIVATSCFGMYVEWKMQV